MIDIETLPGPSRAPHLSDAMLDSCRTLLAVDETKLSEAQQAYHAKMAGIARAAIATTGQTLDVPQDPRSPAQQWWDRGAVLPPTITASFAEDLAGPPPDPQKVMQAVEASGRSYLDTLALARTVEPRAEMLSAMNLVRASEHAKHLARLPKRPA
jgi:hypothetical protein